MPQLYPKLMSLARHFLLAKFQIPVRIAVVNVKELFRLHVLPVFRSERFKSRGNIRLSSVIGVTVSSLLSGLKEMVMAKVLIGVLAVALMSSAAWANYTCCRLDTGVNSGNIEWDADRYTASLQVFTRRPQSLSAGRRCFAKTAKSILVSSSLLRALRFLFAFFARTKILLFRQPQTELLVYHDQTISKFIVHSSLFILHCLWPGAEEVENDAFVRGEQFTFRAYYDSFLTGKVTAGVASLEIDPAEKEINGRVSYHVTGEGRSKGAFNLFFKVEDSFESFIDEEYIVPWYFIRRTREGSFRKNDEVRFNQLASSVSSSTANKKMPLGTQDIISAFYFARTLDFSGAKAGDDFTINYFLDDSVYIAVIRFEGPEEIHIGLGTFRCLKFKPMLAKGKVFSQPYAMDVWITNDKNHIPVLAKSAVIVGSVKLELTGYRNLANPVTSMISKQ